MDSIDDKLKKFQKNCYDMATEDANNISSHIESLISANTNEKIKVYEEKYKKDYEKKAQKLEQDYNSKIFNLANKTKHDILELNEKYINNLKDMVQKEILKFVVSSNYYDFLEKNVEQSLDKLNITPSDNITIQINEKDFLKYNKKLKDKFNYKIENLTNKKIIGGSICINCTKQILIDNSLDIIIDEKINTVNF